MLHEERLKKGKPSKPPVLPLQSHIFTRKNFIKYLNKYLRVAYLLGGFQELNIINLDIIHETAFCDNKLMKAPVSDEHENDIYEDEEIELSDVENDDSIDGQSRKESFFFRFSQWISETFKCQKLQKE